MIQHSDDSYSGVTCSVHWGSRKASLASLEEPERASQRIYRFTLELTFHRKSGDLDGRLGDYSRERGQQRQRNRGARQGVKLENCMPMVCVGWLESEGVIC